MQECVHDIYEARVFQVVYAFRALDRAYAGAIEVAN